MSCEMVVRGGSKKALPGMPDSPMMLMSSGTRRPYSLTTLMIPSAESSLSDSLFFPVFCGSAEPSVGFVGALRVGIGERFLPSCPEHEEAHGRSHRPVKTDSVSIASARSRNRCGGGGSAEVESQKSPIAIFCDG